MRIVNNLDLMQAGGCYVPLDPSSPPERLAFMLKDSGARVLLTHNGLDAKVPESATPEVHLPGLLCLHSWRGSLSRTLLNGCARAAQGCCIDDTAAASLGRITI